MYCDRCGTNLPGDVRFCPTCGRNFGAAAPVAPRAVSRVAGNLRTLAILWMVYSAFRILPGLFLQSLNNGTWDNYGWPFLHNTPFFVHGVLRTVSGVFLITGVAGLIAGWGLMERQGWARILAIVMAFLSLIHVPFGTALGIYTLWVLMPAASEQEYQRIARP
jgi:hypothetical protein